MKNDLSGSFFYDRGRKTSLRVAFRKGRIRRAAGIGFEPVGMTVGKQVGLLGESSHTADRLAEMICRNGYHL